MKCISLAFLVVFLCAPMPAAAKDAAPLGDPRVEARLKVVAEELRCLVCQNQTLSDSNAGLAEDLRNEIRTLIKQGKSDAEIRAFLVARYGDFVLYKPPLKSSTALLWIGPFALLGIGLATAALIVRRRQGKTRTALADGERKRIMAQLEDREK